MWQVRSIALWSHKTIVIAFETTDFETVAEIQACDAADLHGLSEAHRDTGMDVNLAGAQIQSGIVSITYRVGGSP